MTVMILRFFGLPQGLIKLGFWKLMKPCERDLYVALMYWSERNCTRELSLTDAQISECVGTSSRAFSTARKRLQEKGLVSCRRSTGNRYVYVLHDLDTLRPYLVGPRVRLSYQKKSSPETSQQIPENRGKTAADFEDRRLNEDKVQGMPMRFN
jgi:hypothetical protein